MAWRHRALHHQVYTYLKTVSGYCFHHDFDRVVNPAELVENIGEIHQRDVPVPFRSEVEGPPHAFYAL